MSAQLYQVGVDYTDRNGRIHTLQKYGRCTSGTHDKQCNHCGNRYIIFEDMPNSPYCPIDSNLQPYFVRVQKSNGRW